MDFVKGWGKVLFLYIMASYPFHYLLFLLGSKMEFLI